MSLAIKCITIIIMMISQLLFIHWQHDGKTQSVTHHETHIIV